MSDEKKVGRPTKLTEEMMARARAYLDEISSEENRVFVKQGYDKEGEVRWSQSAKRLPSKVGFSLWLGVNRETVDIWARENEEFSDVLTRVIDEQEKALLEEGCAGAYNPAVVNRILSAKHDYKEKSEHEVTGDLTINLTQFGDKDKPTE